MDAGPGTELGALGWFLGVWVVMMAAMMLPSVAPTVALYARMTRGAGRSRRCCSRAATCVVWAAAGVAAYGAVGSAGTRSRAASWPGTRGALGRRGDAAVAAAYELTPLKDVCLRQVPQPARLPARRWRDGRLRARCGWARAAAPGAWAAAGR